MAGNLTNFARIGRKVIGIGRNYSEHAKELGNKVPSGTPLYFLKPPSSFINEPASIEIPYPDCVVHHEVELGVVIGRSARRVTAENAMDYVGGYCLALDMTARNDQQAAAKAGKPWSLAKGYETFCPVSGLISKDQITDPGNVDLLLTIDGRQVQKGNTRDMIFSIPTLISYLSGIMTLEANDVILTGTPAGVGPVNPGQVLTASIPNLIEMSFPVQAAP
eukprot:TRINITY_DN4737_c0_g1_i1.p1 TRINITY_DN4737_c0_g1~~TRINITY_DN4737_c0_g1_i1.p1  ORF type:complete len:220 (+),score=21.92 TRINITY_DN4737_c0_g1_i1:83-742(+)